MLKQNQLQLDHHLKKFVLIDQLIPQLLYLHTLRVSLVWRSLSNVSTDSAAPRAASAYRSFATSLSRSAFAVNRSLIRSRKIAAIASSASSPVFFLSWVTSSRSSLLSSQSCRITRSSKSWSSLWNLILAASRKTGGGGSTMGAGYPPGCSTHPMVGSRC